MPTPWPVSGIALSKELGEKGLPLLAAGNNAELAKLAKRDLAHPTAPKQQVEVAQGLAGAGRKGTAPRQVGRAGAGRLLVQPGPAETHRLGRGGSRGKTEGNDRRRGRHDAQASRQGYPRMPACRDRKSISFSRSREWLTVPVTPSRPSPASCARRRPGGDRRRAFSKCDGRFGTLRRGHQSLHLRNRAASGSQRQRVPAVCRLASRRRERRALSGPRGGTVAHQLPHGLRPHPRDQAPRTGTGAMAPPGAREGTGGGAHLCGRPAGPSP